MTDAERRVVLVEGVSEGDPAAKAGIKEGDRIVEMGGKQIKNLEAYMLFMKDQKKGNTVEVKVMRKEKELKLNVKLE
jgi:S1-C subfamily serine protease